DADVVIDTGTQSVDDATHAIIEHVQRLGYLPAEPDLTAQEGGAA
ncbi:MAG: hypothetical protein QOI26_588, partial [Pseudonocardiales bacterium]|nr:hypothetical protein [Pseudonocardiales bacterium]